MNYIEKVSYIINREKKEDLTDEYHIDISPEDNSWQEGELGSIISNYSFIPDSYIKFIKEFDNLGLSFVTFYGSQKGDIIPLRSELQEFKPYLGDEYFPFAKDVYGSVFVFDCNQKVKLFDIDDYEFEEEPEHIADNFIEFIDDYVLGKNGWQGEGVEEIGFYKFLKK